MFLFKSNKNALMEDFRNEITKHHSEAKKNEIKINQEIINTK